MKNSILSLILLCSLPLSLYAIEEKKVPEKRHTPFGLYLTPLEAHAMKKAQSDGVIFLDTRTRPEIKYLGIADGIDANIPARFINTDFSWSDKANTYRTTRNKHFLSDIDKLLTMKGKNRTTPIMIMCQTGSRSTPVVKLMHEAGFKEVYNLYQGFEGSKAKTGPNKGERKVNGWINEDMPWGYKLDKEAMYFNFDSSK